MGHPVHRVIALTAPYNSMCSVVFISYQGGISTTVSVDPLMIPDPEQFAQRMESEIDVIFRSIA
jgi:hypothetical protein